MKLKLFLAACLLALPLQGDVPGIITYQGRVTSGGLVFNGNGLFKFALVSPPNPGVVTYWSNDGTSAAGSEPTAAVSVTVTDGIFTILLGDASLANMQSIPAAIFANPDVRLRVWFNDGVNGFAGLTPDQRITSAGYALRAAGTPDASITSAMLAANSVTSAHLVDGAVASNDLGPAAVTGPKLADASVGSAKLATPSILTAHLGDGSVTAPKLALGSVLTDKLAAASVTADKLAPGAVTGANVAPNSIGSAEIANTLSLRELTLETPTGLNRIELSGTGDSGVLRMNHGAIGQFLEVMGTASGGQLRLFDKLGGELTGQTTVELGSSSTGGYARLYQDNGNAGVHINGQNGPAPGGTVLVYRSTGLGVSLLGQNGNGSGEVSVYNAASGETVEIVGGENNNPGGQITLRREDGKAGIVLDGQFGSTGGVVQVFKADGTVAITLDAQNGANEGQITTQVLQITGGSDLSEQFEVGDPATAQPGMIVCIDPARPGQLVPSTRAYDRRVAGVISGAGGVKPGMRMGQVGTLADGGHPVALSGRVYCLVDAGDFPVEPGDMITSSDTPGHGMRARDHNRAQGAVVGKAMTRLERGRGLVLVLVTLQ